MSAWTAERFAHEGRHFTIPEVRVIPKPLQQPHPPLYVVCTSPDTIEVTALRGMPMLNSLLRGPVDQLGRSRDAYVKACEKAGRTGAEIASLLARWGVSRHVYVAPTDAEALAEARDAEMWYQESLRRRAHLGPAITMPMAFAKAPTVNGFCRSRPSFGVSTDAVSAR